MKFSEKHMAHNQLSHHQTEGTFKRMRRVDRLSIVTPALLNKFTNMSASVNLVNVNHPKTFSG